MARYHVESLFTTASRAEIRRTLEHLPSKVMDAYKDTMERVLLQPKNDRVRAQRTLSWVFGARRPLKTVELQYALAVVSQCQDEQVDCVHTVLDDDLPHPSIITSCCQGLLVQENDHLLPCHHTAVEYFRETYGKWFPEGQTDIALACTQYLAQERLRTSIGRRIRKLKAQQKSPLLAGSSEYDIWFKDRELLSRFQLLSYASKYWATHFWEVHRHAGLDAKMQISAKLLNWWMDLDLSGSMKLHEVVEVVLNVQGSIRTMQNVVNHGCSINFVGEGGQTLLSKALSQADLDAIDSLLTLHGLKFQVEGDELIEVLKTAVIFGHEGFIRRLLRTLKATFINGLAGEVATNMKAIQLIAAKLCNERAEPSQARAIRLCQRGVETTPTAFYRTTFGKLQNEQRRFRILLMLLKTTQQSDLPQNQRAVSQWLSTFGGSSVVGHDELQQLIRMLQ